jgi:hypothetical protein
VESDLIEKRIIICASSIICMQVTVDIPYASPPQGMKYFTVIGPHIDCMDEHYLVSVSIFID